MRKYKDIEAAEVKKDCFGYNAEYERCEILKSLCCKNEECRFYKTEQEFKEGYCEEGIY